MGRDRASRSSRCCVGEYRASSSSRYSLGGVAWVLCVMLCAVLVSGCARFGITAYSSADSSALAKSLTQGEIVYQKGVQILRSKLPYSSVQVELAQKDLTHNVIALYISAQLAREPASAQVFSPANVRAYFGDTALEVLEYERLRKSDYDFIEILQDFNIPTPTPSVNMQMVHYNISPFYYVASPGFLYFPLMASPFIVENPSSIAYAQEKRGALKVLLMNALRDSTLSSQRAQGGFVIIKDKGITDSGVVVVEVRIANEVHKFVFRVEKL